MARNPRHEYEDDGPVYERPTITVYPLARNKRPVGFARDWPSPKRAKKKRKKAK